MWRDPIVEEIHRYRQQYAARFNYDLDAMCDDIESRQGKDGRKIVSLPPRRIAKPADAGEKPAA
jgi:hypothetical protein